MVPLSIPSPDPGWQIPLPIGTWMHSAFSWWPAGLGQVHAYALCILVGIIAAIGIAERRLRARGAEPWVVIDIAIPAVVFAIVGARIWHVLTHPGDYFPLTDHPWYNVIAVWEGGLAIFGVLLGGAFGVFLGCRFSGLRFMSAADAIAPGLLLAQVFGRLGNYFNHELFGLPTNLPWGLQIESDNPAYPAGLPDGTLFHPTFLYEMIWNTFGVILILSLDRRFRLQWGRTFALYLIWYGAGRSWWESIRIDPSEYYFGIRANVWGAILAIVLGVIIYLVQTRRHTGHEPSVYRPGREWTPADAVDSGDRYSDTDDPEDAVETGAADSATSREPAISRATATS